MLRLKVYKKVAVQGGIVTFKKIYQGKGKCEKA